MGESWGKEKPKKFFIKDKGTVLICSGCKVIRMPIGPSAQWGFYAITKKSKQYTREVLEGEAHPKQETH